MITFGEASGVERERGILRDLVEVWDVGDMNSFESHCFDFQREKIKTTRKHSWDTEGNREREREREFLMWVLVNGGYLL